MSLIQLASLQKIVVALPDHLLLGILGNQQSTWVQLRTAFFHQPQVVLANDPVGHLGPVLDSVNFLHAKNNVSPGGVFGSFDGSNSEVRNDLVLLDLSNGVV